MNKKIIALLISVLVIFSSYSAVSFAAETIPSYNTAKDLALINAVNPYYTLPEEATHFTRIEFVRLLIDVMSPQPEVQKETGFSDVDVSDPHASSLAFAKDLGIISEAPSFNPYDNVTYTQALKMAVTAAGYKPLADVKGGYPIGYLALANDLDLTEGLSASGDVSLTIDDGLKLIVNLFDAAAFVQTGFSDSPVYEAQEGTTFLYLYHKIKAVYGIVNANEYSSVSNPADKLGKGLIKIGTINYKSQNDYADLLGYSVKAYVNDDDELIYADKYEVNEVILTSSDIDDVNGFNIIIYNGAKETKYTLSDSFKYIKNGKAAPITSHDFDPFFKFNTGTVTLADNDGDKKYDVAIADKYDYSLVSKVSVYENTIYDANSSASSITFDDDAVYNIKNCIDGEDMQIGLKQITPGLLIAYKASDDGLLYDITVLNDIIEGKITSVDEEHIYINDIAYKTADYYNSYYSHIALGSEGTFCIGIDGKIAAVSTSGEDYMKYGYFVAVSNPSGLSESKIKIFSQSGKMELLTFPAKISVNNVLTDKTTAKTMLEGLDDVSRFIKYSSNSDGELKKIDIAVLAQNNEFELGGKVSGDSLTKFTTGSYRFKARSSINVFTSSTFSYHIEASTVNFIVPPSVSDRLDDSKYSVVSTSFFVDDRDYASMSAFDLDKSGCAGATLHFADNRINGEVGTATGTAVIEKITSGLDPDGNEALVVYAWKGNKYDIYYSDDELSRTDINKLNPGDLVRFTTDDNNVITSITCDFEALTYTIADDRAKYGDYVEYVMGISYSGSESYLNLITNPQIVNHRPVMPSSYTMENIRNINISKASIVYVDLVRDTNGSIISALPRMSEPSDIRTYLDSAGDASVIVARQYLMTPSLTVVYNIEVK